MKKILITGSRGTIGSILVNALKEKYDLYKADINSNTPDKTLSLDISNWASVSRLFKKIGAVDAIIHLAADPRVDAPWKSVLSNNIIGVKNIYEAARKYKVARVVFASSNHVTGAYEGFPRTLHERKNPKKITIKSPVRPDGDYGSSKIFGEAIARQYYELHGIKSICLRIGTVTSEDDPTITVRLRKTWLSHRDLTQIIERALNSSIEFGIYYAISNNTGRFWSISNAKKELGYKPADDGAKQRNK